MNPDFSSHAANGVNVKTENQCDSKNLIESIESNTFGYSDLSNKILDAQTMIKDAIKLSQQLILYNNVGTMSFSFDFVAGPLVNAVDLLTSSLKALEDNIQLEEKYEVDCNEAINHDLKNTVEKSLNPLKTIQCFVKLENCRKRNYNDIKSENTLNKKIKKSRDSSYNSLYLDEDLTSNYNDFDYDDYEESNDNDVIDQSSVYSKPTRKSINLSKVNYNEETNDWADEDDMKENIFKTEKETKSESNLKTLENSDSNDSDWNEDLDEDYEQVKVKKSKYIKKIKTPKNKELKCDKCDFITTNRTLHSYHKKGWLQWRNCPWCTATIRTGISKNDNKTADQYFEEHIKNSHRGLFKAANHEFICRACKQEFTSIPEYNNHLADQHNLGYNYHCKANCGFTSSNLQIIRNHIKEEHMTCRLCGDKIFSTIKLFNDHNEEKHTPATCNICNEEFKSKHKLAFHMKNTHNSIPEASNWRCCTVCGKSFPKERIKKHMRLVHSNDEEAHCDVCDFVTKNATLLYNHKQKNHATETFLCHLCPFVGTKYQLSAHKNYKHAENKVSCPHCHLSLPNNSKLKIHINRKHAEKRMIDCPEPGCGHKVETDCALKLHVDKVHKGVRWPCTKCDYIGDYRSSLKTHIRVVHEDLGFKCDKCDFTSYKKSLLTKHLYKVHNEGEGMIKFCDLCDYKSESNHILNQHKEHVHQGESYQCFMCTNISPKRSSFRQHLARRHKTVIKRWEFKNYIIIK